MPDNSPESVVELDHDGISGVITIRWHSANSATAESRATHGDDDPAIVWRGCRYIGRVSLTRTDQGWLRTPGTYVSLTGRAGDPSDTVKQRFVSAVTTAADTAWRPALARAAKIAALEAEISRTERLATAARVEWQGYSGTLADLRAQLRAERGTRHE